MTISIEVATDRADKIAYQTNLAAIAKIVNFTQKIAIKIANRTNLAIAKIATVAIPGTIPINIGMKIANFAKMAISTIAKIAMIIGIMIATQIAKIAIMTKEIVADLGDVIEKKLPRWRFQRKESPISQEWRFRK